MGKKIVLQQGDTNGYWEVVEPNVIWPECQAKTYIGRAVFSKCQCVSCKKTIRYIRNNEFFKSKNQTMCKACAIHKRAQETTSVKIGNRYGFLEVIGDGGYNNMRHSSICFCHNCGNTCVVKDNRLQTGNNISCGCVSSRGETIIKELLDKNNIIYNYDCMFQELYQEYGRRLRFDFIIYNDDLSIERLVEFDGNQHKNGMNGGQWSHSETYEVIHERDMIKNEFCLKHNYKLVRIPYHKLETLQLDDILGDKYLITEIEKGDKNE